MAELPEPGQGTSAEAPSLPAEQTQKYSEDQPRDDSGRFGSGGGGGSRASTPRQPKDLRRARALASHKASTAEKQREGDKSQYLAAKALGGEVTSDNDPMDVVLTGPGGERIGVEVKTFCDQANDKVTVHPESRARKAAWIKKERARVFTLVIDKRDTFPGAPRDKFSGARYHVAEGVGSYRLGGGSMRACRSWQEVRAAMGLR